jgi:hypothetical protein
MFGMALYSAKALLGVPLTWPSRRSSPKNAAHNRASGLVVTDFTYVAWLTVRTNDPMQ